MRHKTKVTKVTNETLATLGNRVIDTVNNSGIDEAVNSKEFQQTEKSGQDIALYPDHRVTEKV